MGHDLLSVVILGLQIGQDLGVVAFFEPIVVVNPGLAVEGELLGGLFRDGRLGAAVAGLSGQKAQQDKKGGNPKSLAPEGRCVLHKFLLLARP